jgi:hypothetical protein
VIEFPRDARDAHERPTFGLLDAETAFRMSDWFRVTIGLSQIFAC